MDAVRQGNSAPLHAFLSSPLLPDTALPISAASLPDCLPRLLSHLRITLLQAHRADPTIYKSHGVSFGMPPKKVKAKKPKS